MPKVGERPCQIKNCDKNNNDNYTSLSSGTIINNND